MVQYPILVSQSWSTTLPNFMLVSGIAQSGQNLALRSLAMIHMVRSFLIKFCIHMYVKIGEPLACGTAFLMDEALLSISLARRGQ